MVPLATPVLKTEEYQYGNTGIILNGNAVLPFTDLTEIEGLDAAPVRQQTHDREGVDGGYVDAEFETIRTVTLSGTLYTNNKFYETYVDQLKANFAPAREAKPLYFATDAGTRFVVGKSLGFNYVKESGRRIGKSDFQIQILCEDSRIYSPTPVTGTASLTVASIVGRGYDKGYPYGYGSAITESGLGVNLLGNRQTAAIIRISGPVINPSVIYNNTGSRFDFNTTLEAGSYIEIDLDTKSVLKNGSSNVRNLLKLTGGWYLLSPGNNSFTYLGIQSPPTPLSTVTITAYSAWR